MKEKRKRETEKKECVGEEKRLCERDLRDKSGVLRTEKLGAN